MLIKEEKCTGCGSCEASCPHNCIRMECDKEGFMFPKIDESRCINCHLCEKSCPILNPIPVANESIALAVKNNNIETRLKSSSGGVFSGLAEYVISRGGVVCAARYDSEFVVRHAIITSVEEIHEFRGAKYSQSNIESCFGEIKKILQTGKKVLFVGTPCQVAGLSKYLRKDYINLVLVDMICHGVPSPKVWQEYLKECRERYANGASLKKINLRNKSTGWSRYAYSVEMEYSNGIRYTARQNDDIFMKGFVNNLFLRNSCANCDFKGIERCSDFTLADYWGVWEQNPDFDDNYGTSLVLLHSAKAKEIWRYIASNFETLQIQAEVAIQYNPSAIKSSMPHPKRKEFFEKLNKGERVIPLIQECLNESVLEESSYIKKMLRLLIRFIGKCHE